MKYGKYDRFHLEELIQKVWSLSEDLDTLLWKMYDDPIPPTEDEMCNSIIGLSELHNIRCRRLWECFEELVHEGNII